MLILMAASVLAFPARGSAQNVSCDVQFQMMIARSHTREFEAAVSQYQAYQEKERLNVPVYNARLSSAVAAFHKHITKDDHYKHTNCATCREYLNEIRTYSKKIAKAMK
jgi:hypothetical protein